MQKTIFTSGKKYTFSDYFEMTAPTEDIIAALGYNYAIEKISFPQQTIIDSHIITRLNSYYDNIFTKINLNSELAKREFLIAPLLIELTQHLPIKINVEYYIYVNELLSGSLDYLLTATCNLIVIEAKKKDIDNGFNQLAAELIAMDNYQESQHSEVYGAITLGDLWRFATLNRVTKIITKDIYSYTIPHDTKEILAILFSLLTT